MIASRLRRLPLPWDVLGLWLASRVMVWVATVAASIQMRVSTWPVPPGFLKDRFFFVFGTQWDASWYTLIASQGYADRAVVFFPGYPLLLRGVTRLFHGDPAVCGVILSHLLGLLAGWMLWRYVRTEFGEQTALWAVAFLFFAPSAVHLSANYSESLYLVGLVGAFWAAHHGRWGWAGLAGALASFTRPTGVVVVPALVIYYLQQHQWRLTPTWKTLWHLVQIGSGATGAAAFLTYLYVRFAGLGTYAEAQTTFFRAWKWWKVFWMFSPDVVEQINTKFFLQGFVPAIVLLIAAAVLVWKRRYAEAVLVVGTVWLTIGSGSWEAEQRYALTLFPLHVLLACVPSERARVMLIAASAVMLGYWSALFGAGFVFT